MWLLKLRTFLSKTIEIKSKEIIPTLGAFFFVMLLMASYSILKPVRDAMTSDWSSTLLSTLWTGTFFVSFVAVGIYSSLASFVRLKWLVLGVYGFFASTFLTFYLVYTRFPEALDSWIGYGFYMWVSVFALFHLSVFWSFMSQIYTKEQAIRLFAIVGTGISAGAIIGGIAATFFAEHLGVVNLILLAVGMLIMAMPLIVYLNFQIGKSHDPNDTEHLLSNKKLETSFYDGFLKLITDRQLRGIAVFILLLTSINAYAYFAQKDILSELGVSRDIRVKVWAGRDLAINIATFVIGIFMTKILVKSLGMARALSLVPGLVVIALLVVAGMPMLWTIVGFEFCRRVGNYAITRPSREMLFTQVDPAARFQTKPVIDIVCYRGGDVLWAWFYTVVTERLGASISQAALIWAVIAVFWVCVGYYLGRDFDQRDGDQLASSSEPKTVPR